MFKFVEALSDRGHEVTIITGGYCAKGGKSEGRLFKKRGLFYREFNLNEKIRVLSFRDFYEQKLGFFLRVASFISFACLSTVLSLKQSKVDIIFASSTPITIAIPGIISSKLRKKPFVFEVRDLWPDAPVQLGFLKNKLLISIATALEKLAYKTADSIIGVSRGICKKIQLRSGKFVTFIPNGVDEEFFELKGLKGRDTNNQYPLKVVYAGSCGYNNAIEVLFKVAKKVLNDREISHLLSFSIIGDGPALRELRANPPSNMELKGKLPKKETIEVLLESDIAIFSQRKVLTGDLKKSGLGNKFFDFLGASLPIIVGAVKDGETADEIIRNSCGIVVEPEDVEGLYTALKTLVLSDQLRNEMSISSGKLAMSYSRKTQSEKFVFLLQETIRKREIKRSQEYDQDSV